MILHSSLLIMYTYTTFDQIFIGLLNSKLKGDRTEFSHCQQNSRRGSSLSSIHPIHAWML